MPYFRPFLSKHACLCVSMYVFVIPVDVFITSFRVPTKRRVTLYEQYFFKYYTMGCSVES